MNLNFIKYSWQHLLNFCFLQWFGVRLCRMTHDGDFIKWSWIFVRPLSGYFGQPFIYWGLSLENIKSTNLAINGKYSCDNYIPTDHEINKAVAIALNYQFREYKNEIIVVHLDGRSFRFAPTEKWQQAGVIIEKNNISLEWDEENRIYWGYYQDFEVPDATPLRAMMRAYAKI